MRARDDDGQLLPLYLVVILVACGAIVLLGHLGQLAHRRAQARTAADAAALAGAAEGRGAAQGVAAANGAMLDAFVVDGADVEVIVSVDGTHATARARRDDGCRSAAQAGNLDSALCRPTNRG